MKSRNFAPVGSHPDARVHCHTAAKYRPENTDFKLAARTLTVLFPAEPYDPEDEDESGEWDVPTFHRSRRR